MESQVLLSKPTARDAEISSGEKMPQEGAPLRRVDASCESAVPPVSKWLKQHLTFLLKGMREQQHGVSKAERGKYLSRVGQLGRLW
jgi:hypothetical protein